MDERDDDDLRLPSAGVLDTWTVPEPGSDLADRIADAWQDERLSRAGLPRRRRIGTAGGLAVGAAVGAAAAVLVMLLVRAPAEPAGPIPAPAPPPVAEAAPTGPAPVASSATDHELAEMKADLQRIMFDIERNDTMRDEFLLVLDVEPDDAQVRVTVAGRTVADVVGDARLLLPREPYDVVVEAKGHEPMQLSLTPGEGPETRHALSLTRTAREPRDRILRDFFGRKAKPRSKSSEDLKNPFKRADDAVKSAKLRIGTKSGVAPARVFVDGTLVGATPIASYPVTPGRHTVEWVWDDGRKITQTLVLDADEVRVLKAG